MSRINGKTFFVVVFLRKYFALHSLLSLPLFLSYHSNERSGTEKRFNINISTGIRGCCVYTIYFIQNDKCIYRTKNEIRECRTSDQSFRFIIITSIYPFIIWCCCCCCVVAAHLNCKQNIFGIACVYLFIWYYYHYEYYCYFNNGIVFNIYSIDLGTRLYQFVSRRLIRFVWNVYLCDRTNAFGQLMVCVVPWTWKYGKENFIHRT